MFLQTHRHHLHVTPRTRCLAHSPTKFLHPTRWPNSPSDAPRPDAPVSASGVILLAVPPVDAVTTGSAFPLLPLDPADEADKLRPRPLLPAPASPACAKNSTPCEPAVGFHGLAMLVLILRSVRAKIRLQPNKRRQKQQGNDKQRKNKNALHEGAWAGEGPSAGLSAYDRSPSCRRLKLNPA